MKRILILLPAALILLAGCSANPAVTVVSRRAEPVTSSQVVSSSSSEAESSAPPLSSAPPASSKAPASSAASSAAVSGAASSGDTASDTMIEPSNKLVFNFSELPKDEFPSGNMPVNQLSKKYGAIQEAVGNYLSDYSTVMARVDFAKTSVYFYPEDPARFSFYKSSLKEGQYPLGNKDKDLSLSVLSVRTTDTGAGLPRGIQIGKSTKAQILAAYPKNSAFIIISGDINQAMYNYAFIGDASSVPYDGTPDADGHLPGNITYSFDKNGILSEADIQWVYFDL